MRRDWPREGHQAWERHGNTKQGQFLKRRQEGEGEEGMEAVCTGGRCGALGHRVVPATGRWCGRARQPVGETRCPESPRQRGISEQGHVHALLPRPTDTCSGGNKTAACKISTKHKITNCGVGVGVVVVTVHLELDMPPTAEPKAPAVGGGMYTPKCRALGVVCSPPAERRAPRAAPRAGPGS